MTNPTRAHDLLVFRVASDFLDAASLLARIQNEAGLKGAPLQVSVTLPADLARDVEAHLAASVPPLNDVRTTFARTDPDERGWVVLTVRVAYVGAETSTR